MSDFGGVNPGQPGTAGPTRANPSISGTIRQVGGQLGEFSLLRRLGKGGMAEVWLAEQTTLKRNVALKLLRSELMEDESYVKRFQTEAKAAAGLNHPNIVQVYTVGCEKGQHFIVQEYVHGQTLKALLQKRGPLDLPLALMIMRQVAAALQAAGERGIVHRDIKPENIMLTKKGEVKVADFGLAQLQGGERLHLTQEGVTMGTPLYMSPEQVSGHKLDQRSDIYSFGITCYHMFAGVPPFQGENAVSVAVKHLHEAPPAISEVRPDLPPAVCQMIDKMIAKQPDKRYSDAGVIVNDVRKLAKAIRTGESVDELSDETTGPVKQFPIRRPGLVLPALCILVFLLTAGMGWQLRTRVPPLNPNALGDVSVFKTAREQYVHAMFAIDDEDAFKAVIAWFDLPDDKIWRRRANEQLALLYLKDRRREADARAQLEKLRSFEPGDRQLAAEALVGEAYLDAVANNKNPARKTLQSHGEEFNQYLTGSWKQLAQEVRQMTSEQPPQRPMRMP
ncbi:serine/threonine-protein kinase [Planctomicrobium piriforme]|uniref:non-specific serine/threonine protein kinase n=1 Tax=Planctomicrobium piriforme TaxID=1576369 RepID=A0A1I3HJ49_9PLAN|nr:serine/threonine-protein kinase [Planctomicrobium piriforme]SFI35653.1 serine/threonine protein kinase [Planctomicrobium piriforme]